MSGELIPFTQTNCPNGCRTLAVKRGRFFRKSDRVFVQRYVCRSCNSSFSDASLDPCAGQKKRHLNDIICTLLCGGVSQRRIAFDLNVNRKTVVRKFILGGQLALLALKKFNLTQPKVTCMEFDDMETFVHTKCKPLSITLAVEHKTRTILGFRVSDMPAKGKLAKIAMAKYGPREDGRRDARNALFEEIKPLLSDGATIKSDQNPHYGPDVKKHFPDSEHLTYKGRRGCVVGQGELKRGGFDPLFSLNHTCAMLRANINRMFRRTWCTTKLKERLAHHIALYAFYHNRHLLR